MKNLSTPQKAAAAVIAFAALGAAYVFTSHGSGFATVNGTSISKDLLEQHMSQLPAQLIQGKEAVIRKNLAERLVEQELVRQDAEKSGFLKDATYKAQLDQLTRNFTYNYTVQKKLEAALSDEALKAEYEKAKATYALPAVKARHILLNSEAEAQSVIDQLNAGGSFVEIAKAKSKDSNKANGGDLGWFKPNQVVPTFAQAAFALKKGEYTKKPVQTNFGWHVILVEDVKAPEAPSFDEVKETLKQSMTEKAVNDYLSSLKTDAKISYSKEIEEASATAAAPAAPAAPGGAPVAPSAPAPAAQ